MASVLALSDVFPCRALMASSCDPACPPENVTNGNLGSYWLSTGLYPQELLLAMQRPGRVISILLRATKVRRVRVEGCSQEASGHFRLLAEAELRDASCLPRHGSLGESCGSGSSGSLQAEELTCRDDADEELVCLLRVVILSGWHEFCSVHSIQVQVSCVDELGNSDQACKKQDEAGLVAEKGQREQNATDNYYSHGDDVFLADFPGVSTTVLQEVEKEEANVLEPLVVEGHLKRDAWFAELQRDGLLLRFAQDLTSDKDVVLAAVLQNGDALQFASDELRADRGLVIAAVQQRGAAVQWAVDALRDDREIAVVAVSQNGAALQHLNVAVRSDREVVLAAVRQRGSALRLVVDPVLRSDPEVVEAACETFYFSAAELRALAVPQQEASEDSLTDSSGEADG